MPQSIKVFTIEGLPQTIHFNKKDLDRLAYRPHDAKLILYMHGGSIYYIQGKDALIWYERLAATSK